MDDSLQPPSGPIFGFRFVAQTKTLRVVGDTGRRELMISHRHILSYKDYTYTGTSLK